MINSPGVAPDGQALGVNISDTPEGQVNNMLIFHL